MPLPCAIVTSLIFWAFFACCPPNLSAAPRAELWSYWQGHNAASGRRVDHTRWGLFLDRYLDTSHSSGIYRMRYAAVSKQDKALLGEYLTDLATVKVTQLNRPEQLAFWVNLYNALTVQVVLDHFPVASIRAIDISPGLFRRGPWDAKLIRIEGRHLSLNDIEHRILRPIWQDARLHYILNCASLGCPNLPMRPVSAGNSEQLLEQSARHFINHVRGVNFTAGGLTLSSIYDWYAEDFGKSREALMAHLQSYASRNLTNELKGYRGSIDFSYDWQLNAP